MNYTYTLLLSGMLVSFLPVLSMKDESRLDTALKGLAAVRKELAEYKEKEDIQFAEQVEFPKVIKLNEKKLDLVEVQEFIDLGASQVRYYGSHGYRWYGKKYLALLEKNNKEALGILHKKGRADGEKYFIVETSDVEIDEMSGKKTSNGKNASYIISPKLYESLLYNQRASRLLKYHAKSPKEYKKPEGYDKEESLLSLTHLINTSHPELIPHIRHIIS